MTTMKEVATFLDLTLKQVSSPGLDDGLALDLAKSAMCALKTEVEAAAHEEESSKGT